MIVIQNVIKNFVQKGETTFDAAAGPLAQRRKRSAQSIQFTDEFLKSLSSFASRTKRFAFDNEQMEKFKTKFNEYKTQIRDGVDQGIAVARIIADQIQNKAMGDGK